MVAYKMLLWRTKLHWRTIEMGEMQIQNRSIFDTSLVFLHLLLLGLIDPYWVHLYDTRKIGMRTCLDIQEARKVIYFVMNLV